VAEANLGHADGVVLVDDGQTAILEQREDGIARIEIATPTIEISSGQQDLRCRNAVACQTILVSAHEKSLANGGTCLQLAKVGRPARQTQPAHAGPNGTGTD